MINKYNEFILDNEFNSIINESLSILESNTEWIDDRNVVWDLNDREFEWDLSKPNSITEKLKNFLSKLPKEKIKYYFYELLKKIKFLPKKKRKKLVMIYSLVFLSFVSVNYLLPNSTDSNIQDQKELISTYSEEISQMKNNNRNRDYHKEKVQFDKAQGITKQVEAGYSSDKKDTGNYIGDLFIGTNHGISAQVLADYMKKTPTVDDMINLSYEKALDILKSKYWDSTNIEELTNQNVTNLIYDGFVNQGIGGTKKILREVYDRNGIEISDDDNPLNKEFILKLNELDQRKLFCHIKDARENRYKSLKTFKVHGDGWLSRLNKFEYNDTEIRT